MLLCVFSASLLIFAGCWILHRLLRVFFVIKKEILTVLVIFIGLPILVLAAWHERGGSDQAVFPSAVLCLAISLAYVQTYPALRVQVPTFRILFLIARHQNPPLSREAILERLSRDRELFPKKIEELKEDMFIRQTKDGLVLTPPGRAVALFFKTYRKLLRLKIGRG